jgi:hypothetical protein
MKDGYHDKHLPWFDGQEIEPYHVLLEGSSQQNWARAPVEKHRTEAALGYQARRGSNDEFRHGHEVSPQ